MDRERKIGKLRGMRAREGGATAHFDPSSLQRSCVVTGSLPTHVATRPPLSRQGDAPAHTSALDRLAMRAMVRMTVVCAYARRIFMCDRARKGAIGESLSRQTAQGPSVTTEDSLS